MRENKRQHNFVEYIDSFRIQGKVRTREIFRAYACREIRCFELWAFLLMLIRSSCAVGPRRRLEKGGSTGLSGRRKKNPAYEAYGGILLFTSLVLRNLSPFSSFSSFLFLPIFYYLFFPHPSFTLFFFVSFFLVSLFFLLFLCTSLSSFQFASPLASVRILFSPGPFFYSQQFWCFRSHSSNFPFFDSLCVGKETNRELTVE